MLNREHDAWTRCERLLTEVFVPVPFDLDEFLNGIAARRAKPLRLTPEPDAPCGMLVITADVDEIVHGPSPSPLHTQHTVLHEVGHLLLEHGTIPEQSPTSVPESLYDCFPNLSPHLVRRVLGLSSNASQDEYDAEADASQCECDAYASQDEYDAEVFATLLLARIHSPVGPVAVEPIP